MEEEKKSDKRIEKEEKEQKAKEKKKDRERKQEREKKNKETKGECFREREKKDRQIQKRRDKENNEYPAQPQPLTINEDDNSFLLIMLPSVGKIQNCGSQCRGSGSHHILSKVGSNMQQCCGSVSFYTSGS